MQRYPHSMRIFLFLICFLSLTACKGNGPKPLSPLSDATLTAVAKSVGELRAEITCVAPTLTALSKAAIKMSTPLPLPTTVPLETAVTSLTGPVDTPLAPLRPSATMSAAGATSTVPPTIAPAPMLSTPGTVSGVVLALSTPTRLPQAGTVLFQDDFSSQRSWFTDENTRYTIEFFNGGYRIYVVTNTNPIWSTRSKSYQDVRIEVDAAQTGGPTDGYYGLVCRRVDVENFYILVVSPDGAFGIGKVNNNNLRYLAFTDQYAGLLKPVGNRLRADCIGKTLTLYVDGIKVLETTDTDFPAGEVGMAAGNRTASGTDVLFDNFIVLKP